MYEAIICHRAMPANTPWRKTEMALKTLWVDKANCIVLCLGVVLETSTAPNACCLSSARAHCWATLVLLAALNPSEIK